MRIAIFSNTYLPTMSGVVRSISSYKLALEELGHEVHVFTQGARGYQDKDPNVHRYVSFGLGLPNGLPVTIPVSPSIDRLINDLRPDVIHSQHPLLLGDVAQRKARQLGIPLVYTLHAQYWHYGVYMPFRFLRAPYNKYITKKVKEYLQACDHIISPSKSMNDLMVKEFQVQKPITVIPTGINLRSYERVDRFRIREKFGWNGDFVIISAGRLALEKNWRDLIQAGSQVIKSNIHVKLVLLGDGPQRKELEHQAKELGVSDKVEFVGMVPYEDVASYLVAADLYAFTSLTETQGLGTLEAMAAGLPVAAYEADGTRDVVVNGENGLLTEANSNALAQAINNLIKEPGQIKKLGTEALSTARQLDIRILVKELLNVYENPMS
jgi:glycosyltransferase involved in cell wall biosynthesis